MTTLTTHPAVLTLGAMLLIGCEKPAPPPPSDPFFESLKGWQASLLRLQSAHAEQIRRLDAMTGEAVLTARVRDGLVVETRLLLQLHKSLVTAKELVETGSDPIAARADAQARVTAALQATTDARAQNETLWVNLHSELAKREAVPTKKPEPEVKKEE